MNRKQDSLRGALYRLYGLPASIHDEALYRELVRQQHQETETTMASSGIRESRETILQAIVARAGRSALVIPSAGQRRIRHRIGVFGGLAAAAALLVFFILQPFRTVTTDTIRVAAWSGKPSIQSGAGTHLPASGSRVGAGGRIRTGPADTLTLDNNGDMIFIGGNSSLRIDRLAQGVKPAVSFYLERGGAAFLLGRTKYDTFVVSTPLGSVSVSGTRFSVEMRDSRLRVAVRAGSVVFRATRSGVVTNLMVNDGVSVGRDGVVRRVDIRSNADFRPLEQLLDLTNPVPMQRPYPKGTASRIQPTVTRPLQRTNALPRLVRVHLKSGSVIRGRIIHSDPKTVRIRTSYSTMNVSRASIKTMETIE